MFGISTAELLIILLVALIVLGPTKLPGIARSLGKALGEFRRITTDVQRTFNLEAARIEEEEEKQKAKAAQKFEPQAKPADIPPPDVKNPNPYATQQTAQSDISAFLPEDHATHLAKPATKEKA